MKCINMMFKKILFFGLVLFLFTNCSKRTESMIVGVWEVEDVGQSAWQIYDQATWTFFDNGRLEIYCDVNAVRDGLDVGEWKAFNRSIITPYIEISGYADGSMDGKWRVEKLTKKILVLNRVEFNDGETAGAFLRREFVKQ